MRRKRTLSFHSKEEMLEQEAVEDVEYYLKEEEFYDEISHEKSYKLNVGQTPNAWNQTILHPTTYSGKAL